jgi:DNA segregation ATPase FtsK/SpoIIIE-like protein
MSKKFTKKQKEIINQFALEKYPEVAEYMKINETTVSTSMIQRRFRTGYNTANRLIELLLENNLIESYKVFVGSKSNDKIIDGKYITLYKTKITK